MVGSYDVKAPTEAGRRHLIPAGEGFSRVTPEVETQSPLMRSNPGG